MPRDYKHRNKKKQPTPGWVWGLGGLALGLVVALWVHLQDRRNVRPSEPVANTTAIPSSARADESLADEKPRFDFYELLPKFEVVIPETESEVSKGGAETTPLSTQGIYVLQAGSFRSFADADRMKAQLALQGLQSQIQKVTVDDKRWHRVRLGPYTDLQELEQTRTQLRQTDIEFLVLRVGD